MLLKIKAKKAKPFSFFSLVRCDTCNVQRLFLTRSAPRMRRVRVGGVRAVHGAGRPEKKKSSFFWILPVFSSSEAFERRESFV